MYRRAKLDLRSTNFFLIQSIHGDREQSDREQALDDLKTGYCKILIATDVASRFIFFLFQSDLS